MAFYEDISQYYDYVFPTGTEQVEFICEAAGEPPKNLLDIACGTGGYSLALAERGYDVTATDIDAAMLAGLKQKLEGKNGDIDCVEAGMLDLARKLRAKFDLAFCIGNSIVHLNDKAEILEFLKIAKSLLKADGQLVIQIINFDRVLLKKVKSLPAIKNDDIGLTFERYYRFDEALNKIFFRTVLSVGERRLENEIPLYPLKSSELAEMLTEAGFDEIRLFGDFVGSEFDRYNSYMLVIKAYCCT